MAKVRFQIFKAIDLFLKEWNGNKELTPDDPLVEKLLSVAGACKGGPKDLADRHNHYLYGSPRQ